VHLLGLSVAAHTPDSLRFAGPILVIGRGEERGKEDGMVSVCEIATTLLAALHLRILKEGVERGGELTPRKRSRP